MRRLLSADFYRLKKAKVFRIVLVVVFLLALIIIFSSAGMAEEMETRGFHSPLDKNFFTLAPYMGAFFAVFISFFVGTEHSDGTLRNKLTVGHTRSAVFLSDYLVCLTACISIVIVWLIGSVPGLALIGPFEMGMEGFVCYVLVALGFTALFTALHTWIAMISENKALTVVLTLLLWLGMVLLASGLYDRLGEPELSGGVTMIDREFVDMGNTPNPLYIGGMLRTVLEGILDLNPVGQALLMCQAEIVNPVRQIVFSLLLTLLALGLGVLCFQKKDLK